MYMLLSLLCLILPRVFTQALWVNRGIISTQETGVAVFQVRSHPDALSSSQGPSQNSQVSIVPAQRNVKVTYTSSIIVNEWTIQVVFWGFWCVLHSVHMFCVYRILQTRLTKSVVCNQSADQNTVSNISRLVIFLDCNKFVCFYIKLDTKCKETKFILKKIFVFELNMQRMRSHDNNVASCCVKCVFVFTVKSTLV